MNLVLLPHHNTLTSLQKMQAFLHREAPEHFLPSYPLICVMGYTDSVEFQHGKCISRPMESLKTVLKEADGTVHFGKLQYLNCEDGTIRLVLPVVIPFMKQISEAGFIPETAASFIIGTLFAADNTVGKALTDKTVPPEDARVFRLALMETESAQAVDGTMPLAAYTWKYRLPFWVKLH